MCTKSELYPEHLITVVDGASFQKVKVKTIIDQHFFVLNHVM